MPLFYAIVAMSENRVIGSEGKIPWHLPEDFRWFKQKTMGGTLIMGRRTFESIGKPLSGRKTIILSRTPSADSPVPAYTLKTLFTDYVIHHPAERFWVCGGGLVYDHLLDHCHYLYLTIVKRHVEGDTFFPTLDHVATHHRFEFTIHENDDFRVERWVNKGIPPLFELPPEAWPF
jgi:dihydrofolate reductase